ncbi:MAG: precorrin-2 dehydrogenase/sirohydrochlorin ferrochelatase family protein [Thermoguttaceae bacterium]
MPTEDTWEWGSKPTCRFQALAIDLHGLSCLIVGGGKIGVHKAAVLLRAGARLTVLSPDISPTLRKLVQSGQIRWLQQKYAEENLQGKWLVIAATDNKELNRLIAQDAEQRGILCCNVSAADTSRIVFPAVHAWRGMTVAVHSDGHSCRQSQRLRDRIAGWLAKTNEEDMR